MSYHRLPVATDRDLPTGDALNRARRLENDGHTGVLLALIRVSHPRESTLNYVLSGSASNHQTSGDDATRSTDRTIQLPVLVDENPELGSTTFISTRDAQLYLRVSPAAGQLSEWLALNYIPAKMVTSIRTGPYI